MCLHPDVMAALLKHESPETIETIYRAAWTAKHAFATDTAEPVRAAAQTDLGTGERRSGKTANAPSAKIAAVANPPPSATLDPTEARRSAARIRQQRKREADRAAKAQLDMFPVTLASVTEPRDSVTASRDSENQKRKSPTPPKETTSLRSVEDGGGGGMRASPDGISISEEAWTWTRELAVISKIDLDAFWPPGWAGAPMRVQGWINAGWPHDAAMAAARGAMATKTDGPPDTVQYFERPIARMLLKLSAPLPKVIDLETTYARAARTPRGNRNAEIFAGIRADFAAKCTA